MHEFWVSNFVRTPRIWLGGSFNHCETYESQWSSSYGPLGSMINYEKNGDSQILQSPMLD